MTYLPAIAGAVAMVLIAAAAWALVHGAAKTRDGSHTCDYRPDWLDPDDWRCWCGAPWED